MTDICTKYNDHLIAFVDSELEKEMQVEIEYHISTCKNCSNEILLLQEISHLSSRIKTVKLPPGFDNRFFQKLENEKQIALSLIDKLKNWLNTWTFFQFDSLAAPMLATVFMLVIGFTAIKLTPSKHLSNIAIASHAELFLEYDVITRMELVENYEWLLYMDELNK